MRPSKLDFLPARLSSLQAGTSGSFDGYPASQSSGYDGLHFLKSHLVHHIFILSRIPFCDSKISSFSRHYSNAASPVFISPQYPILTAPFPPYTHTLSPLDLLRSHLPIYTSSSCRHGRQRLGNSNEERQEAVIISKHRHSQRRQIAGKGNRVKRFP